MKTLKYLLIFDGRKVKSLYNYKFLKIKVLLRIAMMGKIKLIIITDHPCLFLTQQHETAVY